MYLSFLILIVSKPTFNIIMLIWIDEICQPDNQMCCAVYSHEESSRWNSTNQNGL